MDFILGLITGAVITNVSCLGTLYYINKRRK